VATVIETIKVRKIHEACGSLIEFSLTELKDDWSSDYLGDRTYYRYLVCPGCGKDMKFSQYGPI